VRLCGAPYLLECARILFFIPISRFFSRQGRAGQTEFSSGATSQACLADGHQPQGPPLSSPGERPPGDSLSVGCLPRAIDDGSVYHALNRGNNRGGVLADDAERDDFLAAISRTNDRSRASCSPMRRFPPPVR
jgi:hypothetical protein